MVFFAWSNLLHRRPHGPRRAQAHPSRRLKPTFRPQLERLEDRRLLALYSVIDLGDLPGGLDDSAATSINENLQVVGSSFPGALDHAFLWEQSLGMQDLGDFPGGPDQSYAFDLNDYGQVVGYGNSPFGTEAFIWDRAQGLRLLQDPNGQQHLIGATAINNQGIIVGQIEALDETGYVLHPSNGLQAILPISTPTDINEHGRVTGNTLVGDVYNAFLWDPASPTSIRSLGGLPGGDGYSNGLAINDSGQIVGFSTVGEDIHAFLWDPAQQQMRDLLGLPGYNEGPGRYSSQALDINNEGQVIGSSFTTRDRAFIWDSDHGMRDLNDLIDPASGWELQSATAINDAGYIVGIGFNTNLQVGHAFLCVPNNSPPTITDIPNHTTRQDTATDPILFAVSDSHMPAAYLSVTAASSNQTLVPDSSILIGGDGPSRAMVITPAPNQFGEATITVTVTDANGGIAEETLLLTVTRQQKIHAFIGGINWHLTDGFMDVQGGKDAQNVHAALMQLADDSWALTNPPPFIRDDSDTNNYNDFRAALGAVVDNVQPGDFFIFYFSSHGGTRKTADSSPEFSPASPEDEFFGLSENQGIFDGITDDDLADFLSDPFLRTGAWLHHVDKFFMADWCHSGGFWGGEEDLDLFQKLYDSTSPGQMALLTSTDEFTNAYYDYDTGESYFAHALVDAVSPAPGGSGFARADTNQNGILTVEELSDFVINAPSRLLDAWRQFYPEDGEDFPVKTFEPAPGTIAPFAWNATWQQSPGWNDFSLSPQDITLASLSGVVFADFNNDGQVDFGETGIPVVTVRLTGTDDLGRAVTREAATDENGAYVFAELRPGQYTITETQPAAYTQGINSLGTAGGISSNDQFMIQVSEGTTGLNYNFGERPAAGGTPQSGQTAGIGFWNNKNGQNLIRAVNGGVDTQLGDWLAATFVNTFGANAGSHNLSGKTNDDVAVFFQSLFILQGPKLEAQVLATALAVYVTNPMLDSSRAAEQYGFTVGGYGVGVAAVNVGTSGDAFGVADGTTMTVMDLLLAADAQAVHGLLYNGDKRRRDLANSIFSDLNQG